MNHAPGAGLIARPVDQQSSVLPLCYGCPLQPGDLGAILPKLSGCEKTTKLAHFIQEKELLNLSEIASCNLHLLLLQLLQ